MTVCENTASESSRAGQTCHCCFDLLPVATERRPKPWLLRAGRPAEGLLAAIQCVGSILEESFPPRRDEENELPDAVREL